MRIDPNPERISQRLHQHYEEAFVGDGAKVEFFLAHTVIRLADVVVTVAGVRQRVSDRGTAYDYKVRGHTPGYDGDRNAIKFTVAPPGAANVIVNIVSV